MSESRRWAKIGEAMGRAIAEGIRAGGFDSIVRRAFASVYGKCRRCDQPLGGESPEKVCHAAEVLEAANGKPPVADA